MIAGFVKYGSAVPINVYSIVEQHPLSSNAACLLGNCWVTEIFAKCLIKLCINLPWTGLKCK